MGGSKSAVLAIRKIPPQFAKAGVRFKDLCDRISTA